MGKYKMVESVGTTLETVHTYEDLEIHHPSQRGREPGRTYADIDGQRQEVLRARTSGNQRMVSKDFILLDGETNSSRVPVPSPLPDTSGASTSAMAWRCTTGPAAGRSHQDAAGGAARPGA